jgi:hypothetical protein
VPAIVTSAEIERPAAEVFACATGPARFREWQQGVADGHMDGPADGTRSPAAGARCVTTRRIGGASRPATAELVHIDPPRTWRVRGIDGRNGHDGLLLKRGRFYDRVRNCARTSADLMEDAAP